LGSPELVREEAARIQNFDQSPAGGQSKKEVGNPLLV